MGNTPNVRFKGFTEDWEQRKLNEVAEKICVGFVGTCEKFYTDESGVPMYRTGNLNGLSLNRDDLKYVTNEFHQHNQKSQLKAGDILIARHGDSGKAVNYESSEEANCLNIVIIRPDFKKCNYKFLTNCINSPECQKHIKSLSAGSTQAVINTSEIEKLGVVMPTNIDEQNRIARYFSNLDNLITLHQQKCDETKEFKKYMLQNMFPQKDEKVPKIRFAGFTGDWEQRKFSDIAARESSISASATNIPSVEYEDVVAEEGRLNKDIHLKEAVKSGITFDGSQVLYGKLRPYLHNWLNPDFKGIAVGDWWVLKPINMDKKFLYRLIQTQQFDNIANQSSGSKMPRADWNLISNSEFMIPFSKEEQSKIGRYFDSLDHLITLHQQKCNALKEFKKYMLQNMFPQKGENKCQN